MVLYNLRKRIVKIVKIKQVELQLDYNILIFKFRWFGYIVDGGGKERSFI